VKAMPSDVMVLQAGTIRPWLERRQRVLSPLEAYEIVLIANEPRTWA